MPTVDIQQALRRRTARVHDRFSFRTRTARRAITGALLAVVTPCLMAGKCSGSDQGSNCGYDVFADGDAQYMNPEYSVQQPAHCPVSVPANGSGQAYHYGADLAVDSQTENTGAGWTLSFYDSHGYARASYVFQWEEGYTRDEAQVSGAYDAGRGGFGSNIPQDVAETVAYPNNNLGNAIGALTVDAYLTYTTSTLSVAPAGAAVNQPFTLQAQIQYGWHPQYPVTYQWYREGELVSGPDQSASYSGYESAVGAYNYTVLATDATGTSYQAGTNVSVTQDGGSCLQDPCPGAPGSGY